MKKAWVLSYPLSGQRRLWSDWADSQADLSLRWAHTHFVGFVMSWLICCETDWELLKSEVSGSMYYITIYNMSRLMTKPTKWLVRSAKTQISLNINPVWSETSLSAWRKLWSLATHWAQSKDWSDWADAQVNLSSLGVHAILSILSWGGSNEMRYEPGPTITFNLCTKPLWA